MTAENTPPARGGAAPKTVQEYIDETPMWADATAVRYSPMTNMHFWPVFLTLEADTSFAVQGPISPDNRRLFIDTQ